MTEKAPRELTFEVLSHKRIMTKLGVIEESKVVFKGTPRTIYTIAGLSKNGVKSFVKEATTAERKAKSSSLIEKLKAQGTTPEQFIEAGSRQFIKDVKNDTHTPEIYENQLAPLLMQKALERVVKDAIKNESTTP